MFSHDVKTGTYEGTGAAQDVTLGFKPSLLIVINSEDGDVVNIMTDRHTAAAQTSIDTEVAAETNGITLSSTGFSLGTGASANENSKTFIYWAIGGSDARLA